MEKVQGAVEHWDDHAYAGKPQGYFEGARAEYVAELPTNPEARILEIGCGGGGTGYLALQQRKCGTYCGVELFETAAEQARKHLSEVVIGNIEKIELPWPEQYFDRLIMSEVLEHLVDPWAVLRKLRPLMKPGAKVFASSPNVSNYKVIGMLIRGDWKLTDMGPMDRTHLRWFTPRSYKDLFESCGYIVDSVGGAGPLSFKAKMASLLTLGQLQHVFFAQLNLRGHCS